MKNLLIFCLAICFTSCVSTSITNWEMVGDITAFNQDGTILRTWNNVTLETGTASEYAGMQITNSSTKAFGLNFIDPETGKGVIIGNSVPYIIEYSTHNESYTPSIKPGVSVTESAQVYSKEAMEKQIAILEAAHKSNTEIINSETASKEEKQLAKKDNESISRELASLKQKYRNPY